MSFNRNNKIIRLLYHTLFWALSIVVFAFIFRISEVISKLDIIYSIFFHASVILCVYINFGGIDRWLKTNKYLKYIVFIAVVIAITVFLNQYTYDILIDLILPEYYFVNQFNSIEIGIIVILYLFITSLVKMAKSWFELQRMNRLIVETEKQKIDSELQSLKSQINPHFLFNSLNVIYSLTLKNDKATPDVVLKLSDILRYVIYDSKEEKVLLSSEVSLLRKYIDLQKYRIENEASINLTSEIDCDVKVAPLIFLILLENSFKHGIKSDLENVFINIKLCSNERKVYFEIENNKSETEQNTQKSNGVGLENIKKRLALEYPDKHQLKIQDKNNRFKVYLEIEHEN